ncbi:MAG: glycerophosphoryl diester phosphodiesterase [Yoonia sp.]|jgi:glycerophosphoryl diester phosphodiesterase
MKPFRPQPATSVVTLAIGLLLSNITGLQLNAAEDLSAAAKRVSQIIAHRGASAERPECTLASLQRAIEAGATAAEIDVRTSRDGKLFLLHDSTLDRTTEGKGPANALTLAQLQKLDAGSWFDPAYRGERIPSLIEAAKAARGQIDLLLDLKEQGDEYDRRVVNIIKTHGDQMKTIVGVRSVAQALRFRELLPEARQLALIPSVETIEEFADAGVEMIRLWPRWLAEGDEPIKRVRATGRKLHLNGTMGELAETLELLKYAPDSLSSDHPARLRKALARVANHDLPQARLDDLIEKVSGGQIFGDSAIGALTFLNREYRMQEVPEELRGLPRYSFNGGNGANVRIQFRAPSVVFAVFDYNNTGSWTFEGGRSPGEAGWHPWKKKAYRGSSNSGKEGKLAAIWFREFKTGQELAGLPPWWVCLGIASLEAAKTIRGFKAGLVSTVKAPPRRHSHEDAAAQIRPLNIPKFESAAEFQSWQFRYRKQFIDRMLFPYQGEIEITAGKISRHLTHHRREYHVALNGRRLFRFYRLAPLKTPPERALPTLVCFMGHGKVTQILDDEKSYQHACATQFVEAGQLVFAMENIGMEPGTDRHLDLDQALRLEGRGWYSLLFAHQRILLDHVFSDPGVDVLRVGVTGVSTGGLLALSAAAMEPRIAAASVQGIFGSMRVSFIRDRNRHCKCGAIPGLLPEFDLPELALLIAPRPLHVSNGKTDGFGPPEAKRCVDLITPHYLQAGGTQPVFTISPRGHEFAFDSASRFFAEHLGSMEAASAPSSSPELLQRP